MQVDADVLLMDIEGTITDIAFVHKVLFPYVRTHVRPYLEKHWENEEIKNDLKELHSLAQIEHKNGDHQVDLLSIDFDEAFQQHKDALLKSTVINVNRWMDLDKKVGPLKQLQGHMWRDAYQSGEIKGHLYPDVIPALRRLMAEKSVKVYIYSSGSVLAQKLLFTYSCEGDVTNLLCGYYDTNIGPKTEAASYLRIAESIGFDTSRILFLTDVEREAYPAKQAGCKVGLVVRDGNAPLTEKGKIDFPILHTLGELF